MLGWEYPPHISGGLGTACEGLTRALSRLDVDIEFIVPQLLGGERAPHMSLRQPSGVAAEIFEGEIKATNVKGGVTRTHRVAALLSPYWTPTNFEQYAGLLRGLRERARLARQHDDRFKRLDRLMAVSEEIEETPREHYGGDIYSEVQRFAEEVAALSRNLDFDVVHAHDWMTFPAGVMIAGLTGRPLVVHVHSLEFDRSGAAVNTRINEIERMGMQAADVVVAVSHYTANIINREHGIAREKIAVVHNGVYPKQVRSTYRYGYKPAAKIVLFLGRITFQKGPDYFVEAAARVIPHIPDVMFVMAGAGDMLPGMVERVHQLGLQNNFHFPGFLRGEEVEQMFSIADLYVMPSVSEPFGIAALEAISFDTPVIISRQSGVSEVLGHALKVDFWDVERMADLIINALLHDELREDMVGMAHEEVKRVRWDASAMKTLDLYRALLAD